MSANTKQPGGELLATGEEMVLRAALREALGAATPPDVTGRVLAALAQPRSVSRAPRLWLSAALLFLGLGATLWIAVTGGSDANGDLEAPLLPPDPSSDLPPPLVLHTLSQVPADVRNLRLELREVDRVPDLRPVARLALLERLDLALAEPARFAAADRAGEDEQILAARFLGPLLDCPELHTLALRDPPFWNERHLDVLSGLPGLQSLRLESDGSRRLDVPLAAVIARLPGLLSLELVGLRLSGEGLATLAEQGRLQRLHLLNCRIPSADVLGELARFEGLLDLRLSGIDWPALFELRGPDPDTSRWLTPEFLRSLPRVRALDLSYNPLRPEQIAALPDSLQSLRLTWLLEADEELAVPLAALPQLTDLVFSFSGNPDETRRLLVALLRAKSFRRLVLHDPANEVLEALGEQRQLQELELHFGRRFGVDLGPLERLRNLRRVHLSGLPEAVARQLAERIDAEVTASD